MSLGSLLTIICEFIASTFSTINPLCWIYIPYWTVIISALCLSPLTIILPQILNRTLGFGREQEVQDEWIIHGKKYNLVPFYDLHPGGKWVLLAAKGSDVSALFESYHLFIDRDVLLRMMSKYEIKQDHPDCPPEENIVYVCPFYQELKAVVREHFRGKGKHAHKMTRPHLAICLAAWFTMWALVYILMFRDAFWTIPCIGVLSYYLMSNVMHDASHNALVASPFLNNVLCLSAFPFGINVKGWHIQHVLSHHAHTNEDCDVDLHHFDPVMTFNKDSRKIHPVLHAMRLIYLFSTAVPHLSIVVPYGLLFGHSDPANGHKMYDRIPAIQAHRSMLKRELFAEFVALMLWFGFCGYTQGIVKGLWTQLSIYAVSSYLFCFFTQVTHLQEECFISEDKKKSMSWAQRQVSTCIDFAPDSVVWGHMAGGLNTQALHHCIPSVSAMHLRSLYPKFRRVCRKHDVDLKMAPSLCDFITGFITFSS